MKLINGYKYNQRSEKLTDKTNKSIKLTKTEKQIITLMAQKHPLATIEEFANIIWLGKKFTKATLRNKIKNIRDKTCYQLIRNNSNIGYGLNTESK